MSTTAVPHAEGWAVPGYVEQRELGHGAFGRVVEAVQEQTALQVAIRYLSPDLVEDPDFLPRFRTQMLKLKELDVPSVVRVYDYAQDPEQPEQPEEPEQPEQSEEPEQPEEEKPEEPQQSEEEKPEEPEKSEEPELHEEEEPEEQSERPRSPRSSPRSNPRSPRSPRSPCWPPRW